MLKSKIKNQQYKFFCIQSFVSLGWAFAIFFIVTFLFYYLNILAFLIIIISFIQFNYLTFLSFSIFVNFCGFILNELTPVQQYKVSYILVNQRMLTFLFVYINKILSIFTLFINNIEFEYSFIIKSFFLFLYSINFTINLINRNKKKIYQLMFQKHNKVGVQQRPQQHEQSQDYTIFGKKKQLSKRKISLISTQSSKSSKSVKQTLRINMPTSLFFMLLLLLLIFAYQGIFTFFTPLSDAKADYIIFYMVTASLIMLGVSKYLVSFAEMLNLYFLLDPVALSFSVALIAFFGSAKCSQLTSPYFAKTLQYSEPITQFILTGTYRVAIKHANFKRWQNILFKIIIFLNGLCFFVFGFYILYSNYQVTKGISPQTDHQFKDFTVLYVFGNLAYYKQLCTLHNNFDRTNKLKYKYKLIGQVENEEQEDQE